MARRYNVGFDFAPLNQQANPGNWRARNRARVAQILQNVQRGNNVLRNARRVRDGIHAASSAFAATTGGAAIGQFLQSLSSDSSVHWSDSDDASGLIRPSPTPPAQSGPQYKRHRPPRLDLTSTQRYRDHPTEDAQVRQFGRPPNWLQLSLSQSQRTPRRSSQSFNIRFSPAPKPRRQHIRLSQRTRVRHFNVLRRFVRPWLLRHRLSRRAAQPGRRLDYLRSALRQTSRRILDLRKKYILAHRIYKPEIRRSLAAAKRAQWLARRRFQNALS